MRTRTTRALLALVPLLALAARDARAALPDGPARSRGAGAYEDGKPRVRARLLVDAPQGGGPWRAGVLFEMAPGWYLYWRHPGDVGMPTRVELALAGEVGTLEWPAPTAYLEDDLLSYGYAGQVLLAAPLAPAEPGTPLAARADVLVCESQCLPASFELERPALPEADAGARAAVHALFESAAASVPRPAAERGVEIEPRWRRVPGPEGGSFEAELRITRCGAPPADCAAVAPAGPLPPLYVYEPADWFVRATLSGVGTGGLTIALAGEAPPRSGAERTLRAVLPLRAAGGAPRPVELALPLPEQTALAHAEPSAPAPIAWLRALLLGFAGGLILNLMPCVLPVLALKVAALASLSQRSRREVFAHALAYAAGVELTLVGLALGVLLLSAGGTAVGWGFQLQEPLFVAAIAMLLVTFATNLFGAFELEFSPDRLARVGEGASGPARSFFDGLLAVVLATPCSAPFLGTAVGFAFASAAPVCVAIFAAIGLGLAAPFAAVSLWPGLARRMPRGGAWMQELRRGLAFALLLTALWLVWITARQSGADAAAGLGALLLCVAAAGWIFGAVQRARGRLTPLALAAAIVAIAWIGLGRIAFEPQAAAAAHEAARPYQRSALLAALAEGRPAFVYFTADWCLTCKLNERRVLDTEAVQQELARLGFAVFRADWTRRDATITGELARLGRAGVPVYALYARGRDEPRLLPDLLSQGEFERALREAAGALRISEGGPTADLP